MLRRPTACLRTPGGEVRPRPPPRARGGPCRDPGGPSCNSGRHCTSRRRPAPRRTARTTAPSATGPPPSSGTATRRAALCPRQVSRYRFRPFLRQVGEMPRGPMGICIAPPEERAYFHHHPRLSSVRIFSNASGAQPALMTRATRARR